MDETRNDGHRNIYELDVDSVRRTILYAFDGNRTGAVRIPGLADEIRDVWVDLVENGPGKELVDRLVEEWTKRVEPHARREAMIIRANAVLDRVPLDDDEAWDSVTSLVEVLELTTACVEGTPVESCGAARAQDCPVHREIRQTASAWMRETGVVFNNLPGWAAGGHEWTREEFVDQARRAPGAMFPKDLPAHDGGPL